jgi:hypothetical protein
MTDIYLFGMPRSGNTIVRQYLLDRLSAAGVDMLYLSEFFSPYMLFDHDQQGLSNLRFPRDLPLDFDHDTRLAIFENYHHRHRFIKQMHVPGYTYGIERCITVPDGIWLIMDRADTLEHCLSVILARVGGKYNIYNQEEANRYKSELSPFEADLDLVRKWLEARAKFQELLARLFHLKLVFGKITYETMVADCDVIGPKILERFGISVTKWKLHGEDDFMSKYIHRTRKLFSLDDKKRLVTNWQAVQYLLHANT